MVQTLHSKISDGIRVGFDTFKSGVFAGLVFLSFFKFYCYKAKEIVVSKRYIPYKSMGIIIYYFVIRKKEFFS